MLPILMSISSLLTLSSLLILLIGDLGSGVEQSWAACLVSSCLFSVPLSVCLRSKLAVSLGEPWTRDGEDSSGMFFLSMMFIVALYLPWCRYLGAQYEVQPQLYADTLKCVSRDPAALLRAARFTVGYVRMVGQEPAPSKCVLMSTSRVVRSDMRDWVLLLMREIAGRLSWIFVILVGILILLFGVGLLQWLQGFVLVLPGWCIFCSSTGFSWEA